MPRLLRSLVLLGVLALLATAGQAQPRSLGLTLGAIDDGSRLDGRALRSSLAEHLQLTYTGDRPIRARMVVVVTEGGETTGTWISDFLSLMPGSRWDLADGTRPIPLPTPDVFPDGGVPGAAASSWLPWPFCWFAGCDDDETAEIETDGDRKYRELQERERRQNDFNHLTTYGLQAAPGNGSPGTSVVTMALIPEAAVAEKGDSRVQVVTFTLRSR